MKTLDELKENWAAISGSSNQEAYAQPQLEKIFKSRVSKHTNASMQYFWASFTLQIIVYSLLCHVIVKYWGDTNILWLSIAGILLYVPFTVMLMQKFKQMASAKFIEGADIETSMQQYASVQYGLLKKFYRFKKRYELMLIPLSAAIGVLIMFKLYVPGGITSHPIAASVAFAITIMSCEIAIRSENIKSFEQPLAKLKSILDEFTREG